MSKQRVILKVSGESFLSDDGSEHLDPKKGISLASKIQKLSLHYELALVLGGGNIMRGRSRSKEIHSSVADQMGMLSTLINALFFKEFLGDLAIVFSSIETPFAESYRRERALKSIQEGRIIILAGGSGSPHFTTDTACVLKGIDLDADEVWKATLVEGIYDKDPHQFSDAKLFKMISYDEAIALNLQVMDQTAFALAKAYSMKLRVFSFSQLEHIYQQDIGTRVYGS